MQKALLIILVAVLSFVGWQAAKKVQARLALVKEVTALEEEIEQLKVKNVELLDVLEYVKTDAFLEREGRLRFGLGKPGEKAIVISDLEKSTGDESVFSGKEGGIQEKDAQQNLSNPQRWWRYFFGRD